MADLVQLPVLNQEKSVDIAHAAEVAGPPFRTAELSGQAGDRSAGLDDCRRLSQFQHAPETEGSSYFGGKLTAGRDYSDHYDASGRLICRAVEEQGAEPGRCVYWLDPQQGKFLGSYQIEAQKDVALTPEQYLSRMALVLDSLAKVAVYLNNDLLFSKEAPAQQVEMQSHVIHQLLREERFAEMLALLQAGASADETPPSWTAGAGAAGSGSPGGEVLTVGRPGESPVLRGMGSYDPLRNLSPAAASVLDDAAKQDMLADTASITAAQNELNLRAYGHSQAAQAYHAAHRRAEAAAQWSVSYGSYESDRNNSAMKAGPASVAGALPGTLAPQDLPSPLQNMEGAAANGVLGPEARAAFNFTHPSKGGKNGLFGQIGAMEDRIDAQTGAAATLGQFQQYGYGNAISEAWQQFVEGLGNKETWNGKPGSEFAKDHPRSRWDIK